MELQEFVDAYVTCALWASTDESDPSGGEPMDANYDASDIAEESMKEIREVCEDFFNANRADIGEHIALAGHDFWLTRNGHGAGFWDRSEYGKEQSKRLTEACKPYGESYLYVGDDGKVYVH
jgi:hypothetical protein